MSEFMKLDKNKVSEFDSQINNIIIELNENKKNYQKKFTELNKQQKEITNLKNLIVNKSKNYGNEFSIWYAQQIKILSKK